MRKPEGLAAVNIGKDIRTAIRLKSGGIPVPTDGKVGTEGQAHSGCLETKRLQVSALLGATPGDTRT